MSVKLFKNKHCELEFQTQFWQGKQALVENESKTNGRILLQGDHLNNEAAM